MTTARIGAIGENDVMLIFKAVGVDVFPVEKKEDALHTLTKLAKEGYAVIFITESVAFTIDAEIIKYSSKMLPSIVVVPGLKERNNYALKRLRQSIIKAVGADVMKEK
ncbi:MAG: V-type ATP synthase subunit F [bacterium (Candidatus Stahlbacteria) CG23_combo_of_CG06-09_8_20_14_all_34_7]|nr:MAG: V-type ATP synthase subunit F [bacterium (Candidatus Stahlbacteria) CG23_combo_of_CG06-09_8_20_14_all_34_7]